MTGTARFRPAVQIVVAGAILAGWATFLSAAQQGETERLIQRITPAVAIAEDREEKQDQVYWDTFFEKSDILQGSRWGHWTELTNYFGYSHKNIRGYALVSQFERFDDKDFTQAVGTYISLKDSYLHFEAGFGWDVDYIYKFQSITEYAHLIAKGLYAQIGFNYRNYDTGDTFLLYPGLIYYFGDSYMSVDYGVSYIEGRDTAQFVTAKGDFAITSFLHWSAGMAYGERLYDIYALDARAEVGYILFTGVNVNLYKGINLRAGYSYSFEKPKFLKRSLNGALSVKF